MLKIKNTLPNLVHVRNFNCVSIFPQLCKSRTPLAAFSICLDFFGKDWKPLL